MILTEIPEPAYEYGYTGEQIEQIFTDEDLIHFSYWMRGQTRCMTPEGVGITYAHDVRRYIAWRREGVVPVWD